MEVETILTPFCFRGTSRNHILARGNYLFLVSAQDIRVECLASSCALRPFDGVCIRTGGSPITRGFPRTTGDIAFPQLNAYGSPSIYAIVLEIMTVRGRFDINVS